MVMVAISPILSRYFWDENSCFVTILTSDLSDNSRGWQKTSQMYVSLSKLLLQQGFSFIIDCLLSYFRPMNGKKDGWRFQNFPWIPSWLGQDGTTDFQKLSFSPVLSPVFHFVFSWLATSNFMLIKSDGRHFRPGRPRDTQPTPPDLLLAWDRTNIMISYIIFIIWIFATYTS